MKPMIRATILVSALLGAPALAQQAPVPPAPVVRVTGAPYQDPRLSAERRTADLIPRMTLEEKFWQLFMLPGSLDDPTHDYSHGVFGLQVPADTALPPREAAKAHAARINAIQRYLVERTRLGIPMIPFDEALHGLMREGATVFPQAIGLAATWDSSLTSRVHLAAAGETRSRGIRQVLSPVVNITTDVRWGRVEETSGEDPFLTTVLGRAFVRAFESNGIVTTPKHFVANVGDGGRDSYPIEISPRQMAERHFPPFASLVRDAGARSVMTSYNSVDGLPATQNGPLLNGTLKRDWGFTGFVISDAAATGGATVLHHTEASTATATQRAFAAGLDVVFQSEWPQHRPYLAAFQRGLLSDSVMNAAVARVLSVKFELGLFDRPYVDPESTARVTGSAAHRALAREAARKSLVLLKNAGSVLPLRKDLRSIAVIGPDAVEARLGGYSGRGIAPVSILDGIRGALGEPAGAVGRADRRVRYAPGPGRLAPSHSVVDASALSHAPVAQSALRPGLQGEYYSNNRLEGTPALTRVDARIDFGWTLNSPGRGIPFDWYSVRWTGWITAPPGGIRRLGVEGNDGYRLWLNGRLAVDNWEKRSFGAHLAIVDLAPGSRHEIRLEYRESVGNARVKLVWLVGEPPMHARRAAIDSAVAIARTSDVAIIVAGLEEGEFRDRAFLHLPGEQEAMIAAVAATGTPTVVVIVGGSAVTMSKWIDQVRGVLFAWYPGEEGGNAVADVLFGDENPAGRLPITFPMSEGQLPLTYDHKPTGRGDDYVDLTGQPLFPFGYGLSYTTFEYSNLRITPDTVAMAGDAGRDASGKVRPGPRVTVRATVKNTGDRPGDEVVQLYLRDVLASVARPIMMLRGFTRVHLAPGESREVTFTLGPAELQMLDADMKWIVEPGLFRVLVGASSRDIRLRGDLIVR
jgi:beta-glucosidase